MDVIPTVNRIYRFTLKHSSGFSGQWKMPNGPILRSQTAKANPTIALKRQSTGQTTTTSRSSLTTKSQQLKKGGAKSTVHQPSSSKSTSINSSSPANKSVAPSNSVNTPVSIQNPKLSDKVNNLESRLSTLETLVSQLTTENTELRLIVTKLQSELTEIERRSPAPHESDAGISAEQLEINTNIVIRGIPLKGTTPESELRVVYEGIRSHLNISDCAEFEPVSLTVLASNTDKDSVANRPIRVQLRTVAAKTKFLQIRRVKKDIFQSDIGINCTSRRSILITEQLTRRNQELLYRARSLRCKDSFKFVWSSNGQILARQNQNSKVIRIVDAAHVNQLRSEANLEPLPENGRFYASTTGQISSNDS